MDLLSERLMPSERPYKNLIDAIEPRESPAFVEALGGIAKWFAVGVGFLLLALIGHGIVGAIGLVPFLLLCLLFQNSAKST